MTGGALIFKNCKPFSDARMSLFCFQVSFIERTVEFRFETSSRDIFLCFPDYLDQILYAFTKRPDKLFLTSLKEKDIELVGT